MKIYGCVRRPKKPTVVPHGKEAVVYPLYYLNWYCRPCETLDKREKEVPTSYSHDAMVEDKCQFYVLCSLGEGKS